MKYNINNLDEFKGHINPVTNLMQDIAMMITNSIEDGIKELIKPYLNTNYYEYTSVIGELQRKGFRLECFENDTYKEYRITYIPTGKYDFFIIKNGEFKQEGLNVSYISKVSEITRGIE